MLMKVSPKQIDLELIIKENIELQTRRQLRRLQVSLVGNQVTVAGEANSYYIKQLALASVLKTVSAWGPLQIVHNIHVKPIPKSLMGIMDW